MALIRSPWFRGFCWALVYVFFFDTLTIPPRLLMPWMGQRGAAALVPVDSATDVATSAPVSLPMGNVAHAQELPTTPADLSGLAQQLATLTDGQTLPPPPPSDPTAALRAAAIREEALARTTAAATRDELLAPTIDADSEDRFVIEKVDEIGCNPDDLFAFVRDEIGFESYLGSLRGARGTLWSEAGNALDQASLLIAMMRHCGIPAGYAFGTLADAEAQDLILSMFPPVLRVVGCPDPNAPRADPANDPELLAESRQHVWVEFGEEGSRQAADPAFGDAIIGQTFTTPDGDLLAEVPDELRHLVTFRLVSESSTALAGLERNTRLEAGMPAASLVGRPVTVGHFVDSSFVGGLVDGTVEHVYSPYLLLNEADGVLVDDELLRGQSYVEFLSALFPVANQLLLGVFLQVELTGPGGSTEVVERSLLDRIGFAARRAGGVVHPSGSSFDPALTQLDQLTFGIDVGATTERAAETLHATMLNLHAEVEAQKTALEGADLGDLTPEQLAIVGELQASTELLLTALAGVSVLSFTEISDQVNAELSVVSLVRSYFSRPRITMASSRVSAGEPTARLQFAMDLVTDTPRVLGYPTQLPAATRAFRFVRGLQESSLERALVQFLLPPLDGSDIAPPELDALTALERATQEGIPIAAVDASNQDDIVGTAFSEEATIRINDAVREGRIVVLPTSPIDGNTAWFEIDPVSGEIRDVTESGGHSFAEYIPALEGAALVLGLQGAFFLSLGLNPEKPNKGFVEVGTVEASIATILAAIATLAAGGPFVVLALAVVFIWIAVLAIQSVFQGVDPPVPGILVGLDGFGEVGAVSGTGPVRAEIVQDELFTVQIGGQVIRGVVAPIGGGQLPFAQRLRVENTTDVSRRWRIEPLTDSVEVRIKSSIPVVELAAGGVAEVGLCTIPRADAPDAGATINVVVAVTDEDDPTTTVVADASIVVPELHGLDLELVPTVTSMRPNDSGIVELRLKSVGNVDEAVGLSADEPEGIALTNLPSSLLIGAREEIVLPLTIETGNVEADRFGVVVMADLCNGTPPGACDVPDPKTRSATLLINVRSPEVFPVEWAAIDLAAGGEEVLAVALSALTEALAQLEADPTNSALCDRVERRLSNVITLLNADPGLAPFATDLQPLLDAAAACDSATLFPAIPGAFTNLKPAIVARTTHSFKLDLTPANASLEPGVNRDFTVRLENTGSETTTINLALDALPVGVTASPSPAQVTLAPGEVQDVASTITVMSDADIGGVTVFPLTVTGTAAEAPSLQETDTAHVAIRPAEADVLGVTLVPNVLDAGETITLATATILNSGNAPRSVIAHVLVPNPNDPNNPAHEAKIPVDLVPSLDPIEVDLGAIPTDGLADGLHAVQVSLLTVAGEPLRGRSGSAPFYVGSPVSATVQAEPAFVPPGDAVVPTIVRVASEVDAPSAGENLEPTLDWSWTNPAVLPISDAVTANPAVVDLTGDGVPELVFVSLDPALSRDPPSPGQLRAISGLDGSEVFTLTDPALNLNAHTSMAVGDIDGDTLPEIVGADDSGTQLVAFEHDGTFKWRSDTIEEARWGGIAIADLDADGSPEIIHGRQVLDATGTLLWTGIRGRGRQSEGSLSLAADLDLDGILEVVAGNSAYTAAGALMWGSTAPDGWNAVADFDDDAFPEVVLVSGGQVWLLEHDGTTKWGPVALPDGVDFGGPPTVGNFDTDPEPEIGVAGRTRYAVLEADGSFKWQAPIQDDSSRQTGSSLFDFDADGLAEVVYRDEFELLVLRGADGAVRFRTPICASTRNEYPVIADVDADGEAEIVAVADALFANAVCPDRGIYVFGSGPNERYAGTRRIWNQHAYHITNVNQDGTVPPVQQNNWQVPGLNNFRLNTFAPSDTCSAASPVATAVDFRAERFEAIRFPDDSGHGGTAEWVVAPDGSMVTILNNAPESVYVSRDPVGRVRVEGHIRVNENNDDDNIGFVFGFRGQNETYLLRWRNDRLTPGASEHLNLQRRTPQGVVSLFQELLPWQPFVDYRFVLTHDSPRINVTIFHGSEVFAEIDVEDDTFDSGRFGPWAFSQAATQFFDFTVAPLVPAAGCAEIDVRHLLVSPSDYAVDPNSVTPVPNVPPNGEVGWSQTLAPGGSAQFQLTGIAPDVRPGEVREISDGTEITARIGTGVGSAISASATGSTTPAQGTFPESVPNGDFTIMGKVDSPVVGDGFNDVTTWDFDFTPDSGFARFGECASLASAQLTLILSTDDTNSDFLRIEGLPDVIRDEIQELPVGGTHPVAFDLLDCTDPAALDNCVDPATCVPCYTSEQVLGALDSGGGQLSMLYDDDAIVSFAQLALDPGPGCDALTTTLTLPPVVVAATHIISIDPPTATIAPGDGTTYTVELINPLATPITYALSTVGLGGFGVDLATSVMVGPGQTAMEPLTITAPNNASEESVVFSVIATADGFTDAAQAQVVVAGDMVLPTLQTRAVHVAVEPVSEEIRDENGDVVDTIVRDTVGRGGTEGLYTVTVTNLGDQPDTYDLNRLLPPGFSGTFLDATDPNDPVPSRIDNVFPGLGNFRQVRLTLTAADTVPAGSDSFTVEATSTSDAEVSDDATATVNVSPLGVQVELKPDDVALLDPSMPTMFTLTVTNHSDDLPRGPAAQDVFDLGIGGPAAIGATLSKAQVMLEPGASEDVMVTTGPLNFALPGALPLTAIATAQDPDQAIRDTDTSIVTLPSSCGLKVEFKPAEQNLDAPGEATFLLEVQNTGNQEIAYTAAIQDPLDPDVEAGLDSLTGQLVPSVDFRLPGLSTGAIPLVATLLPGGDGQGDVTVQVRTQEGEPCDEVMADMAIVRAPTPSPTPTVTPSATPTSTSPPTPSPTPTPAIDCIDREDGAPCDDEDPCTQADRCRNEMCIGGPPILAADSARISNDARVFGDVGVNDERGKLAYGRRAFMADGTTASADRLQLGIDADVDSVAYNRLNSGADRATIRGQHITPLDLPLVDPFCMLSAFECGGPDVTVAKEETVGPLAPGTYGDVDIKNGGVLLLQPGEYTVCAIKGGKDIVIQASGPEVTTINVVDRVRFANDVFVGPAIGAPLPHINVAGRRLSLGQRGQLHAHVTAPDGRMAVGSRTTVNGTICVDRLTARKETTFSCMPTCGDGQEVPGEGCDDGNAQAGDGCSIACLVECGDQTCVPGEVCINGQCSAALP